MIVKVSEDVIGTLAAGADHGRSTIRQSKLSAALLLLLGACSTTTDPMQPQPIRSDASVADDASTDPADAGFWDGAPRADTGPAPIDAGVADAGAADAGPVSEVYSGYALFSPNRDNSAYLIDADGRTVHTWRTTCGISATHPYLLEDGTLLRPCQSQNTVLRGGGTGGRFQKLAWDGQVLWDFQYASATVQHHHDIEPMPNGNVLFIAWELKNQQEAIAAGRQPGTFAGEMWPLHIVEVEPDGPTGGNIVWTWHAWDHLVQDADPNEANYGVVADHPELLDVNLGSLRRGGDWIHANGLDYDPARDEIIFSSHTLDEVYVIDHSTTTAEAAGHTGGNSGKGGDLLYRWGNPQNYGAGSEADRRFFVVHGANWIDSGLPGAGNIIAFDNGDRSGSSNDYSTIREVVPPRDANGRYILTPGQAYGPADETWAYSDRGNFYSNHLAVAYRLANGNTFITEATRGHLLEVTADGRVVWEYQHPGGMAQIPRAIKYGVNYPGLAGRL